MEIIYQDADLVVVDDFLERPGVIRGLGVNADYSNFNGHDGETYKRVSVQHLPEVQEKLEVLMKRPIQLLGMGFRLNYADELPNNEIHADLGWGAYAAVLYLSEPSDDDGVSGTAFWSHKETGADRIKAGDVALYEAVKNDWNDETKWEQTKFVSAKYNSVAVYRSELFHSRWPFEAFGSTPEDGRLVVVVFFS